jgi:molecular chaperone GrpE
MSDPTHNEATGTPAPDQPPGLEELARQRDEFRDLAKSIKAEFENYQKRQQRDLLQERRFAQSPLALDLLPAIDNLDRAIQAARQAGDQGPLATGVQMVLQQILDQLKRHGIVRMDAKHQPFDAARHTAVTQFPSADHPAMTVLEVLESGYMHHDRVLRPASVAVAAPHTANSGD